VSKQGNDFWIQYQKDYSHIDMGAMLEAYADARESKEIAELKAKLGRYQTQLSNAGATHFAEIGWRDAEIKRLRDGIQKVADHLWVREPRNMSWLELRGQVSILHGLLSPAPITEDEDYDPEFCPQCNSMEWYNGDGECEYGCHH